MFYLYFIDLLCGFCAEKKKKKDLNITEICFNAETVENSLVVYEECGLISLLNDLTNIT